jgi:hypothetical protein
MPPTPDDRFGEVQLPPGLIWGHRCVATDPGPWIEYAIDEGDPSVRTQLVVLRLETVAKIYGALAESAAQAARIHAEGGGD